MRYPVTPDGRYFVVRGRLWRCANPGLAPAARAALQHDLMAARRAKGVALRAGDDAARGPPAPGWTPRSTPWANAGRPGGRTAPRT